MDIQEKLVELENFISTKKKDLLKQQNELFTFVDTEHKAKATEAYQRQVRSCAAEINTFLIDLIETKENAEAFKKVAQDLCKEGMELNSLTKDMLAALATDLAQRQKKEDLDTVKNVGVIAGLAVAAVTISKPVFDPNSSHAALEALFGATAGIWVSYRRQILGGFQSFGKAICASSKKTQQRLVYNLKKQAVSVGDKLFSPLANEASFVITLNDRNSHIKKDKNNHPLKVA